MPSLTKSIAKYLKQQAATHNDPALLARWHSELETQVNVAQGDGKEIEGRKNVYTDGKTTWMPRRTKPGFKDAIKWPFAKHVEAIGTTGWNFVQCKSEYVAYDLDAIANHVNGLSASQLAFVVEQLKKLPYAELRKSSKGAGVHVWVAVPDVPTKNHTQHSLLARFVLDRMGRDCGYQFADSVDGCGGNTWIWHSAATTENGGYSLIQSASASLTTTDIPDDWLDQVTTTPIESEPVECSAEDCDKAIEALSQLSPKRCDDYHEWIAVGMILKAAGLDCETWDAWSKQSDRYKKGACKIKWATFNGRGLSLATLFAWAAEDTRPEGEEFPDDLPIEPSDDDDDDEDIAIQIDSIDGVPTGKLLHQGLIRKVAVWHAKRIQYPDLRLGAVVGILLQSMLMARKIRLADNTRPNLVVGLPILSGGGKTDAVDSIKLVSESLAQIIQVIEDITGAQALEDELHLVGESAFLIFEESHNLIRMLNSTGDNNLGTIARMIKKLYSMSKVRMPMRKKAKTPAPRNAGNLPPSKPRYLDQPHLTVLLTGPPGPFWDSFSEESLRDGLVGRIAQFDAPLVAKGNDFPESDEKLFAEIVRIADAWSKVQPPTREIYLASADEDIEVVSIQSPVPFSWHRMPEGQRLSVAAKDEFRRLTIEGERAKDEVMSSCWARAHELSCKLELILAGSEIDPNEQDVSTFVIPVHVTQKAIELAQLITNQKLAFVRGRSGDLEHGNKVDKVLARLNEHKCMRWRDLYRKPRMKVAEFVGLIESLVMSGEVETDAHIDKGRVINHRGKRIWLKGHAPPLEKSGDKKQ